MIKLHGARDIRGRHFFRMRESELGINTLAMVRIRL
jgi:hypothetical protein